MMKLRPFEIVLITSFTLLGLIALALLSTYRPGPSDVNNALTEPVVIWGTAPKSAFDVVLGELVKENKAYNVVSYREIDSRSFDSELIRALAENRGPDIVLLSSEKLIADRNMIQPVSYDSFPLKDFKSLYVDGAEIFALNDGIYSYPVAVDPLVMYYNRDLLGRGTDINSAVNPPTTWESLVSENGVVRSLVQRDFNHNILLSPIAFGDYSSIKNSFGILSMLILQGGGKMISQNSNGYQILLNESINNTGLPLETALNFYTQFGIINNPLYSWNRSLQSDYEQFAGNKLVLYFGKGSESKAIATKNPNLNFEVAEVPGSSASNVKRTYGSFYGLSLLKSAKNQPGAYLVLQQLGGAEKAKILSDALNMAPAHRSTLSAGSNDRFGRVNYQSAVYARGWLNPDLPAVDSIFKKMVEDVLSNVAIRPSDAASDALGRLRETY